MNGLQESSGSGKGQRDKVHREQEARLLIYGANESKVVGRVRKREEDGGCGGRCWASGVCYVLGTVDRWLICEPISPTMGVWKTTRAVISSKAYCCRVAARGSFPCQRSLGNQHQGRYNSYN